jgi:DNA-binding NarL/FixJ family response regulator
MPAKILITDDNSVTRKAIRYFLGWHSFQICGEARCDKEAAAKVRELKPDIVLLDINMPDMNGIRTANEILRASRRTKIVFLSVHDTPATMKAACMWADGFGAKSAAGIELIPTLCRVAGNRSTGRQKDKRIS